MQMDGWKRKRVPPAPLRTTSFAFRAESESIDAAFHVATKAADKDRGATVHVPEEDVGTCPLPVIGDTIPDDSPPAASHAALLSGVRREEDDSQREVWFAPLDSDEEVESITSRIRTAEVACLSNCCFCADETPTDSQMCHGCKQKMKLGTLKLGKRVRP